MLLSTCNETKKLDKKWLLEQIVFKDFIFIDDSITNITFNFDTNEIFFDLNVLESQLLLRDEKVSNQWKIEKNVSNTYFVDKINPSKIIIRSQVGDKYKYVFSIDN
jgi:hypothetical protein